MRGRKPKIDGEKRGHHKKEAPLPPPPEGAPECPAYITGEARKEWARLCEDLAALNRLSFVDRGALEGASLTKGEIVRLQKKLPKERDQRTQMSLGRQLNQNLALRLKHLAELGLTPVSRARVKNDGGKPSDPFEDFLRGGSSRLN